MSRVGRPAKVGKRYPGGQLVDEPTAKQKVKNMAVAVQARQRVHGLTERQAASQEGGTALGRLIMGGGFASREQGREMMEAAECFMERRAAYDSAIQAARLTTATDYTGTSRGGAGGEGVDPAYVDRCHRARARYAEIRRAILEADPLAMMALEQTLIDDVAPRNDAMMGALRSGLNAIYRILRSERKAA